MSNVVIYVLGMVSGLALAFLIIVAMLEAAKRERIKARNEQTQLQRERDAAYDRGYDRALYDQRRLSTRSDAEKFADAFEGRRVRFVNRGEVAK